MTNLIMAAKETSSGWTLREVERACDKLADKRRVSFPDLHNIN